MVSNYQVKKGPYFDHDIDRLQAFLLANDCSEKTIQRYFNEIYHSMTKLKTNPRIGANLSTKTSIPNEYRYVVSGQYLIFYKVFDGEKIVRVYRVFHGKENYLVKLGLSV